jgi:hypothetical protein
VIDGTAVKPDPDVKIELLGLGQAPGAAGVQKLKGSPVVVVTHVLDEHVGGRPEFPFKLQRGLKSRIQRRVARKPDQREHAFHAPALCDGMRPGKLDVRLIAWA